MNIKLYKYINETELLIYSFDYYQHNNNFRYTGMQISRRNNKDDVWGHHWAKYFTDKKYKELDEYERTHDFDPSGWDYNPFQEEYEWDYNPFQEEYDAIYKKYNPIENKTETGKPYLEGTFSTQGKLPPPVFTKEEILEKLKIAVAEKFKDVTVVL
jgi:hypothetical protein